MALGAGSGMDVNTLAKSLAEADVASTRERIKAQIGKTETRISGYGALNYALSALKGAFDRLNDASDFGSPKVSQSQPSAMSVTATSTAQSGNHSVEVLQLARAQRSASAGFASPDAPLGQPLNLSLTVGSGSPVSIAVPTATPAGVVAAINSAGQGLTAQLLDTGSGSTPHMIVVTGKEGVSQAFTLTSNVAGLAFSQQLSTAADASLRVNGVTLARSSNTVSDAIPGVTLNLLTTTTAAARVDVGRDSQVAKDNIKSLVQAYNDFEQSLDILGDRSSEVETLGGSLAGDTLLRSVRAQVRNLIVSSSSTPGGSITAARDVGLSLDRKGRMTLDEAKLDTALASNLDNVTRMFTAGTNNKSLFSPQPAGLAGDAMVQIDRMLRSTGTLTRQTEAANRDLTGQKDKLKALDARMERILERYMKQFSLMESVVGESNSVRAGLKNTFDAMSSNKG